VTAARYNAVLRPSLQRHLHGMLAHMKRQAPTPAPPAQPPAAKQVPNLVHPRSHQSCCLSYLARPC
jgi:hypothetical protein